MARNRGIKVQIAGEFNPKGFEQAQKAAEGFSDQMKGLAKTVGAAFVTREITNFAKSAVSAASDLGESVNAVNVTFGEASQGILALGENAATAVGLSQREFNSFAVQFSGFTQQIAGSSGDIVAVTDELTTRIADFASVMNQDIPDAAQVFQSALAGETEPIRRFGIDMSAAAVETHALATGLIESKSEMTEAIKVQARYSLLMQSTNKVAGDFANTSDSLANQQRILTASLDDAKATIGQALIPALESVLSAVKPLLDAFTELPDHMQQIIVISGLAAVGMKSLSTTIQGLGLSAKTSNKLVLGLGGAMTAGLVILNEYSAAKNEVAAAADRVKQSLDAETGAVTENTDDIIRQQLMTGELGKAMEMLSLDVDLATEAIMGNDEAAYAFIETLDDARERTVGLGDGFKSLFTSEMQAIDAARIVQREYQGMRNGFDDARDELERLNESTETNEEVTRNAGRVLETVIDDYGVYADSMTVTSAALTNQKNAVEELLGLRDQERSSLESTINALMAAGDAAGYEVQQTRAVIESMGLLDGLTAEAKIELGVLTEGEEALAMLDAVIAARSEMMRAAGEGRFIMRALQPLFDLRANLSRAMAAGETSGGGGGGGGGGFGLPEVDEVQQELERYVTSVVDYGNRLLGKDFAERLFAGSADDIANEFDSMMMELAALAEGTTSTMFDGLANELSSKFTDLMHLADMRDLLKEQLDGIREIQNAARGLFTTGLEATEPEGDDIKEQLRSRVAMAQRFVMHLNKLKGMGFPAAIIKDVVNAGIIDGGSMAAELAKFSPDEVAQVTEQVAAIEAAQRAAGDIVGDLLGAPTVEAALTTTEGAMRDLTDAIQTDLYDAFSTFLIGLGEEVDRLTNPALRPAGLSARSANRTSGAVNITVNMPAGSNGEDVVRAVKKYARNTGVVAIPVTDKIRS